MSQQQPPAGWYDDPSGRGGSRYWNGSAWTDRTKDESSAQRDRLPDGWMMLNGERVPLGQMTPPAPPRSPNRGMVVAVVVAILVTALIGFAAADLSPRDVDPPGDWTFSETSGDEELEDELVAETQDGSPLLTVHWSLDDDWSSETDLGDTWTTGLDLTEHDTVVVRARASDASDVVTCRIVDRDGPVLVETNSGPGGPAICRWER